MAGGSRCVDMGMIYSYGVKSTRIVARSGLELKMGSWGCGSMILQRAGLQLTDCHYHSSVILTFTASANTKSCKVEGKQH